MPSLDYPHQFYVGRLFDPASGKTTDKPYLYTPEDLTTHAVVVGMTGSGKTGLCLNMMEEAALNNLPAILIDPKGDITNLLLHFPEFRPADFEPWVNPDTARREGKTIQQTAAEAAETWKNGLAGYGIEGDRVARLNQQVDYTIYSPGSTSGKPLSILASLRAPAMDYLSNLEVILEQIEGTVTALLSLVGMNDIDPVTSREHILLSNIFQHAWSQGKDLDLGELILQTQSPPFEKLGVFPVEQFYPQKDRFGLAMRLNNILASPAFQPWITGEPLDVASLLYTPEGKPRHSIFYIAHLGETERMFIVTLLFGAIETWMRRQKGTTNLRALVYFDEIFGYLPPIGNPPSKKPMLRMLKQARAFGVGLVLATQNPVDVDYKALSNAGSWFIGRLQTDRDKQRLLDGLEGASGGGFDRSTSDKLLSSLGKRVFLVNNVHSKGGPQLFQTRWAMNYLAGPMTRTQLAELNALVKPATPAYSAVPSSPATPSVQPASFAGARGSVAGTPPLSDTQPTRPVSAPSTPQPSPLANFSKTRPAVPTGVQEYFLPRSLSFAKALDASGYNAPSNAQPLGIVYLPALLAQAEVRFADRSGNAENQRFCALVRQLERSRMLWDDWEGNPLEPRDLESRPEPDFLFSQLPTTLSDAKLLKTLSGDYVEYVFRNASLTVYSNATLKLNSKPGESRTEFEKRCEDEAERQEDLAVKKVEAAYATKLNRLKDKLKAEERELERDKADLNARRMEEMSKGAETLMNIAGAFLGGGRRSVGSKISSSMTKRRLTSEAAADVAESEQEIADLQKQIEDLQADLQEELEDLDAKWNETAKEIDEKSLSPRKSDVALDLFGVVWQPHWALQVNGEIVTVSAF